MVQPGLTSLVARTAVSRAGGPLLWAEPFPMVERQRLLTPPTPGYILPRRSLCLLM